jgi:hypothetical protein
LVFARVLVPGWAQIPAAWIRYVPTAAGCAAGRQRPVFGGKQEEKRDPAHLREHALDF